MQPRQFSGFKVLLFATVYSASFLAHNAAWANPAPLPDSPQIPACPTTSSGDLGAAANPNYTIALLPVPEPQDESAWRSEVLLPLIIRRLVDADQPLAALQLIRTIPDREVQQSQLYTVLDLLIYPGRSRQLAETIAQIDSAYPELQPQQLDRLISALMSARKADLAMQLVQTVRSPELRAQAMEIVAAGLAEMGEFDRALEITQTIESAAVQSSALADIAEALAVAGRIEEAQSLFATAIQQAKSLAEPKEQVSVLADIAHAQADAGLIDDALEILSQIPQIDSIDDRYEQIRIRAIMALSNHLYESGETAWANQLIQQAIDSTFELNNSANESLIFSDITTQLVTYQQIDRAVELNQTLEERRFSFVRQQLVKLLAQQNQITLAWRLSQNSTERDLLLKIVAETIYRQNPSRAFDIAQSIRDRGFKVDVLDRIAGYWLQRREYAVALNIAYQLRAAGAESYRFQRIASQLSEAAQYESAVQVAAMISDRQRSLIACQKVLVQAVENLLGANQVDRALQITSRITIPEQSDNVISSIARYLFLNGDREQALSLVNRIQNQSRRSLVLGNFVYLLAQAGDYDQALQFAQTFRDAAERSSALLSINRTLISARQYDRALALIEQYSSKRRQAQDLSIIAVALIQAGETERGFALLNRALAIVNLPPLSAQLFPTGL